MSKTVIITGASRGIGRAIATGLSNMDVNIVINSIRNIDLLKEVQQIIINNGAACEIFTCDVSNYEQVKKMFEFTKEKFGPADILINNAGISEIGVFQDTTPKKWQDVINTNLGSVYNCCHLAVPDMIKQKSGKIINISSVWGCHGASCEVAYSAAKGGVNAFTKALAKELAPSNIQVNAIACGAIDTDMNSHLSNAEKRELSDEIPAGRFGRPDEVSQLVNSLIDMNSYLTGQVITLDGGWI